MGKSIIKDYNTMPYAKKLIFEFVLSSLPNILNSLMMCLPNFISIAKMGKFSDSIYQATMGLIINCHYMFFMVPSTANYEVMAIFISKYFGKKDYKNISIYLYKSLFFQLILNIFGIILFCLSEKILLGIGFDDKLSKFCGNTLINLIIVVILQGFNELLRNYLITCNIFYPFLYFNLASLKSGRRSMIGQDKYSNLD